MNNFGSCEDTLECMKSSSDHPSSLLQTLMFTSFSRWAVAGPKWFEYNRE